jgi:hypothetical protein
LTQNDRVGNLIKATGIYGKFVVTAGDTSNIVRVIFYIPKSATDTLSGVSVQSLIDLDLYTILSDKYYAIGTNGGPNQRAFTIRMNFHRGFRTGIPVTFTGAGSTTYAKNPIRMYVVSNSGASPHPTWSGNLRFFYKDA